MEIDDNELGRILAFIEGREPLSSARADLEALAELLERVKVVPGGRASDVDRCFEKTITPSAMARTQLRLALHYLGVADSFDPPTLSSFVVLRVAIECMASAHWLISCKERRVRVERMLKRMWWDTQNAVDMALVAESNPDLSGVEDLRKLIVTIASPVKGVDASKVIESKRVALGSIVKEASRALRPSHPYVMYASWMACSGVSHGNITVSAGVGVDPRSILSPAVHPIDAAAYMSLFTEAVVDLRTTVEFFQQYATEEHTHRRPSD